MIRRHVELTRRLAGLVTGDDRFEIVAPHPLNLLCIAVKDDDSEEANHATDTLVERANATGKVLFTRTVLDGRSVLRASIGARSTELQHVEAAWNILADLVGRPAVR